jgi:hypothetical protein
MAVNTFFKEFGFSKAELMDFQPTRAFKFYNVYWKKKRSSLLARISTFKTLEELGYLKGQLELITENLQMLELLKSFNDTTDNDEGV